MPLSALNPYLTKLLIDDAYAKKNLKLFLILALIGAVIFLINGAITALGGYLSRRLVLKVQFDITKKIYEHIQGLGMDFFKEKSSSEYVYKINTDISLISSFTCDSFAKIISLIPHILLILAIVTYLNWKMALLALLIAPLGYLQQYFFTSKIKVYTQNAIKKSQSAFDRLYEALTHILLVKAFRKEEREIATFNENFSARFKIELQKSRLSHISNFSSGITGKLTAGIVALYGGLQIIRGDMTLGGLTAVMIYIAQLSGLLSSAGSFYQAAAITSVSASRINEILDEKPKLLENKDALGCDILQGKIDFNKVSFAYKDKDYILKDITFTISANSKIALVGRSGCGKTTLLYILLRLYGPSGGIICIDGVNIKDIKSGSLAKNISIALQEAFLFNDTIENNILYGAARKASTKDVLKAAELTQAHEFIKDLPKGYAASMGEMACKLSEGQKQRIALARAVINRPKILILDEAMSSLDSETENKIMRNLKNEFKDSTLIVVSHRLSAVKQMDKVYFLNEGILEIATHQEFLNNNADYIELFAGQIEQEANESKTV
ncbi:MAG: ABC transporter ATP-binding protein [Candidatus Omnitrophica bacterium]|nr:ABC transporter ATP-binding protein [Candidatus Omnitrophota bacterium]